MFAVVTQQLHVLIGVNVYISVGLTDLFRFNALGKVQQLTTARHPIDAKAN